MKVTNRNGYALDYDAAVNLMDDDIRERLHNVGYDTEQDFFTAYETAHEKEFDEEWELSKENPVW